MNGIVDGFAFPVSLMIICSVFVEPAPVPPIPNEQQLARLTDYVAFLENWLPYSCVQNNLGILCTDSSRNLRFILFLSVKCCSIPYSNVYSVCYPNLCFAKAKLPIETIL